MNPKCPRCNVTQCWSGKNCNDMDGPLTSGDFTAPDTIEELLE